ncbi:hypothetical protein [Vulgatibacter sp.]|uniref:hypothetical protein n=1 Tax=Vulgatibacter sp. TaxID=1971226 RepID=UPI0035624EEC
MAETALTTVASVLLAQAQPLDQPGAAAQAWPFLIAGVVILAVVIWAIAGGKRRRGGMGP